MIVKQPQSRGVDIFNNVSLPCSAVGRPAPSITWSTPDGAEVDFTDEHFRLLDDGTLFIQGSPSLVSHDEISFAERIDMFVRSVHLKIGIH